MYQYERNEIGTGWCGKHRNRWRIRLWHRSIELHFNTEGNNVGRYFDNDSVVIRVPCAGLLVVEQDCRERAGVGVLQPLLKEERGFYCSCSCGQPSYSPEKYASVGPARVVPGDQWRLAPTVCAWSSASSSLFSRQARAASPIPRARHRCSSSRTERLARP